MLKSTDKYAEVILNLKAAKSKNSSGSFARTKFSHFTGFILSYANEYVKCKKSMSICFYRYFFIDKSATIS